MLGLLMPGRLRRFGLTLATVVAAIASAVILPAPAEAGSWVVVSCVNPNHSAAPSDGWSSFYTGGVTYGSNNSTSCQPGSPMFALLSTDAAVPVGYGENLEYTPPGGSTLIGGTIDVSMYADGGGYNASGTAVAYTPNFEYSASSVFFQCAHGLTPCYNNTNDYEGTLGLPANRGGRFYIGAGCGGAAGYACDEWGSHGAWALVYLWWANFTLSNGSTPGGASFSGPLLQPNASGTADLGFTATDPGGPGVYLITVKVDGNVAYSSTPDTNSGHCVIVGTAGGADMFDYNQPCKQTENVNLPVDTTSLADGTHSLTVLVTDAAQNVSTVYDGTITTDNAPLVLSSPNVSGTAQVGSVLTGAPATFEARGGLGPLSAITSQWLRCSGPGTGCSVISGATSTTYTPVAADKGYAIEYENSVEDSKKHKASTVSAPTLAVTEAPAAGGSCTGGCQQQGGGGSSSTTNTTTINSSSSESLSNEALAIARGAANGSPASDQARIAVSWVASASASSVRTAYTRRARAQGRLVASSGQPIAGAAVTVVATPSSPGYASFVEGSVRTADDGTFVFDTQGRRPSRTLRFEYKSHVNDVSLAAMAQLSVGVSAPISLRVSPRTVRRGSTITMSGSVPVPIPAGGKQIVLQALAVGVHGAKWQTFNVVRTNARGRFRASYRFRFAGPARYRIRAITHTEQDYPYLPSTSTPTLIKEQ